MFGCRGLVPLCCEFVWGTPKITVLQDLDYPGYKCMDSAPGVLGGLFVLFDCCYFVGLHLLILCVIQILASDMRVLASEGGGL